MAIEQPLIHDSRVLLGPERDAFGLHRMQLDWRIDDQVYHTIRVGGADAWPRSSPSRRSAG